MKKLLIIITLFVSSFFLFFRNEVKAFEYTKEVDFSIMEDVLTLKEMLDINLSNSTLYPGYIIYYKASKLEYYVITSSGSIDSFTTSVSSTYFRVDSTNKFSWGRDLNQYYPLGTTSSNFIMFQDADSVRDNIILYSSFDIKYTTSNLHTITYTYQDFSYTETFVKGEKMSTLYDIYLKYQEHSSVPEENPHQEEIDKVTNFYTMIIEKIEYLSDEISNNYILLFVIGIFILTFVFLLIFRRFL